MLEAIRNGSRQKTGPVGGSLCWLAGMLITSPFPPLIICSARSLEEFRLWSSFPPVGGGGSGDGPFPSELVGIAEPPGSTGSADRTNGPPPKKWPPAGGAEPPCPGGAGSWYSSGGELFRGGERGGEVFGEMELLARGDRPMGPDLGTIGSRGGPSEASVGRE